MKKDEKVLIWKADLPALFAEILNANNSMWVVKVPFIIVDGILREGAAHAIELQDEKMISIFARLGMYEGCSDTKHHDYKRLRELSNKNFNNQ